MMGNVRRLLKSCKILLVAMMLVPSAESLVTPAPAQGLDFWNKPCLKAYKKWKTLAPHKAFAVSNSNSGGGIGQACGYTWSAPSKSAAEKGAVKSCEGEKRYRGGKCYVTKSE
ncbi:MAG: hypothetical protein ABL936_27665 [Aestuariivirga sp.]